MKSSDSGTVLPRAGAETEHLTHFGGLAGTLFRLARERFTGVLYAEAKSEGGVFSLREGRVVFFEDLREGQSVPDLLLEIGLITKLQYADIAAEVVSMGAASEDVAFCRQAVTLGVVSQEQLDIELGRRIRQRVVQAVGWDECRTELDPDPDSLSGILEYPQALAPLVYTGIRTFFDEDRVEAVVPQRGPRFVRLLCPERDAVQIFELDEPEVAMLMQLKPDTDLAKVIEQSGSDPLEVRQLVCALVLAQLAEVGSIPLAQRPRSERRLERSGEHRTGPLGRYSAGGVREERVLTGPLSRPVTPPPGRVSNPPPADRSAVRRTDQRIPVVQEERVGPLHPLLRDSTPAAPPNAGARPASQQRSTAHTGPVAPPATRAVDGQRGAEPAARRASSGALPAAADAAPAAHPGAPQRSAAQLRRPRTLGKALQRLDRELKHVRPGAAQTPGSGARVEAAASPPPEVAPSPAAQPAPSGRANVEHLMRMRRSALDKSKQQNVDQATTNTKAAADSFRNAMEALRLQKFPRAHELFGKACSADPGNATYALYCQYAAFRASLLSEEDIAKLRVALREKVSDADLKGFAYYALGHVALAEKKDEAAEKFFLKATELDKENKDAERHLRILELRRKNAGQEKGGILFGKR